MTEPADIRLNLQQGILEWDDGVEIRSALPTASVLDFGAIGDLTVDDTTAFQRAVASVPREGGRIRVPWKPGGGFKLTNTVFIRSSNTVIELDPGAFVKKDSSTNFTAPFRFQGDTPGAFTTFADATANSVTILVASSAGLAVGDWIEIKDDEPPATGSTGTHHEINRIRAIASNVLTLYYPLCDDYVTISAVLPSVRRILPVVQSGIEGYGRIQNGDSDTVGNAGVDFSYCVGGFVKGAIEFDQIQEDAIRFRDSMGCLATGAYMHDTTTFLSRGRGISTGSSTHIIITKNRDFRSRHAFDISFFSRYVLVEGNTAHGSALAPLKAHPNCKWIWFKGNTVDGCYGYDSAGTEWGTNTEAVGGSVDQECEHVTFDNNEFANIRNDGILVIPVNTNHIVMKHNRFKRTNTDANTSSAAIRAVQAAVTGSGTENRGYVIEGNEIVDCDGRGIVIGMNGAVVRGNKIREIRASTGTIAGILVRAFDPTTPAVQEVLDVVVDGGNRVEGCDGHGIQIGTSDAKCRGTIVKDSILRDCELAGIMASPQFNGSYTIEENDVENCNNQGSGDNNTGGITAYSASGTAGATTAEKRTVKGNHCRGVMRNGIIADGSEVVVKGNVCLGITSTTGSIGIGINIQSPGSSNTTDDVVVESNTCIGCDTDGIRVASSSGSAVNDTRVLRNTCIGNAGYGIRIREVSTSAVLDENYCAGNATGDYLDAGTTTVKLENTDGTTNRIGRGTLAPSVFSHTLGRTFLEGSQRVKYRSTTADDVTADDYFVRVDSSGAARTITLPATDGSGIGAGFTLVIKRNSAGAANNVTINRAGSNTIDGATSKVLATDNDSVTIISNGGAGAAGDWKIV